MAVRSYPPAKGKAPRSNPRDQTNQKNPLKKKVHDGDNRPKEETKRPREREEDKSSSQNGRKEDWGRRPNLNPSSKSRQGARGQGSSKWKDVVWGGGAKLTRIELPLEVPR